MKKYIFLSITLIFFVISVAKAQNQAKDDSIFVFNNYVKKEYQIVMRDGIKLHTAVYSPLDASKTYPFLMKRTPYSCSPYGETKLVKRFQNMALAREGYIFVYQDVRGKYMSEGEFMDVRPYNPDKKGTETDENSDTYDTIDWLLKNVANNNGRVGIYGISYPGFYSSIALPSAHPALKAVSPQAPVTDWFIGDDFHHNGALMLMDAFNFYSGFGKARPKPLKVTK
jgi:uncharacterized protein